MPTSIAFLAGLTAIVLLSAGACETTAAADGDDDAAGLVRDGQCAPLALAEALVDLPPRSKVVDLTAAELDGDCLVVTGRYGGGCVEDELGATAQRSALAVYPPIYVVTMYDLADDNCEALEMGTGRFSIATLRQREPQFDLRFEGLDDVVIEVR